MKILKVFSTIFVIAYLSTIFSAFPVFADEKADKIAAQQELQRQLDELQNQINLLQGQLTQTQAEKNTLNNKIKQLKKQQSVLNLQIQATTLQIAELDNQITVTETSINQNLSRSENLKKQIGNLLRQVNEQDSYPFLYVVVSKQNLSDVFSESENYSQTSKALAAVLQQIREANQQLAKDKQQFEEQQQDAQNLLSVKTLQQTELNGKVGEQSSLLATTKGREADYQIALNDTKAQAAAISSRIYELLGISGQITFGEAYKIAQWAQGLSGIRPAFLLAVITQESNLGKNVGTCNRLNDPPQKSYKVVMKPDRDIQPFLQITSDLGLDPDITPVSCPQRDKNGNRIGWGGAMGPAQFIPSTWMGYKDKVAQATGKSAANPWDIRDAFAAAAIKLTAGGADGTPQGEWDAAMRYFSGSTSTKYRFYGDSVMSLADKYQSDINDLNKWLKMFLVKKILFFIKGYRLSVLS